MGRGNQLRITLVLSDQLLAGYAANLLARYRTYRDLIDQGKVKPTQNQGFAAFEQTIKDLELERLVAEEPHLTPAALRERNLALMKRLNPGRVFPIEIPVDTLIRRWAAQLTAAGRKQLSKERSLALINQLLPTRLWVTELKKQDDKALKALVDLVPNSGEMSVETVIQPYLDLLRQVSHGFYPADGGRLRFAEFTAIHPVGTFNSYTTYQGHKIPQYPTPGRRALTYHQRSMTVDHIPEVTIYGYLSWLPYMHVGKPLHNSFHTLWWQMDPAKTAFLPEEITGSGRAKHGGKRYKRLWLLARGPMSHGCTHVNAGHISELRELLSAAPKAMDDVDVFINKPHLYDVFDIDGDLMPEMMAVSLSTTLTERAGSNRSAAAASGRQAVDGQQYGPIGLYEAKYEPEKIQFYRMVDIPFSRELRRAGSVQPRATAD